MSRKLSVTTGGQHPYISIGIAATLKENSYSFIMILLATVRWSRSFTMIEGKDVSDCVEILGTMLPEKVREHMERTDIFLFTSDFNEDWGAVLNESKNSGCTVEASHAIGSVPSLIKNGENGLIYENGSQRSFENEVTKLMNDQELRLQMGRNAYKTIKEQRNAENSVSRLKAL